jgi:hypothetical protein
MQVKKVSDLIIEYNNETDINKKIELIKYAYENYGVFTFTRFYNNIDITIIDLPSKFKLPNIEDLIKPEDKEEIK